MHKPQAAPRREFPASLPPGDLAFLSVPSWALQLLIRIFFLEEKLIFQEVFAPSVTQFWNSAIPPSLSRKTLLPLTPFPHSHGDFPPEQLPLFPPLIPVLLLALDLDFMR